MTFLMLLTFRIPGDFFELSITFRTLVMQGELLVVLLSHLDGHPCLWQVDHHGHVEWS